MGFREFRGVVGGNKVPISLPFLQPTTMILLYSIDFVAMCDSNITWKYFLVNDSMPHCYTRHTHVYRGSWWPPWNSTK